jgi:hypothetical protein
MAWFVSHFQPLIAKSEGKDSWPVGRESNPGLLGYEDASLFAKFSDIWMELYWARNFQCKREFPVQSASKPVSDEAHGLACAFCASAFCK